MAAVFLAPAVVGFGVFYLYPSLRALYLSFTDFNLLRGEGQWVGAANYERVLGDPLFWHSMGVTARFVLLTVVIQTLLAIFIALLMDRLTRSVVVRSMLVLPWLVPGVIVALLWLWLLDPSLGIVNQGLRALGLPRQSFLGSPGQVLYSLVGINIWRFTGYVALIIFAGLQMIPRSLYEAAAVDGATEWSMFWRVTMPLLRPVMALVLVLTFIGSFQVFDTVHVATGVVSGNPGGPANASLVIYLYIFRHAFDFNRFGTAAAASALLFVLLMIITLVQLRLLRASESDLA